MKLFERPSSVQLRTPGEVWDLLYRPTRANTVACRAEDRGRLVVYGRVSDIDGCTAALRRWLRRRARTVMQEMVSELAVERGLPEPERLRIGMQRSRWGSCSANGTISMNARCLFLPPELTRSILIHELCHLVHLNHSREFYMLVAQHDPSHDATRAALREAMEHVPAWSR